MRFAQTGLHLESPRRTVAPQAASSVSPGHFPERVIRLTQLHVGSEDHAPTHQSIPELRGEKKQVFFRLAT